MTDLPEIIDRLGANAWGPFIDPEGGEDVGMVRLPDAIQAVRLAYDRGRERRYHDENGTPISIPMAEVFRGGRQAATREIVEALRDQIGSDEQDVADAVAESAADFIESRFIQGDE